MEHFHVGQAAGTLLFKAAGTSHKGADEGKQALKCDRIVGWREGSELRVSTALPEDLALGGSQLSDVTPGPGDLMLSSGLHRNLHSSA